MNAVGFHGFPWGAEGLNVVDRTFCAEPDCARTDGWQEGVPMRYRGFDQRASPTPSRELLFRNHIRLRDRQCMTSLVPTILTR